METLRRLKGYKVGGASYDELLNDLLDAHPPEEFFQEHLRRLKGDPRRSWSQIRKETDLDEGLTHLRGRFHYLNRMEYRIVLRKGQDGYYVAQCLEVPGAISQGRTKKEALRNAKKALELVLEVLKEEATKGEIARVKVNA